VFRLLGLLGGLSIATDLGTGAPMEESLKRCIVATRLARSVGCPDNEVSEVIYTALLQHLGCTAYAHELAQIFGDDIAVTRLAFLTDLTQPRNVLRTWVPGVADATGRSKTRVLATTLLAGKRLDTAGPPATCEVARDAARRLGLPVTVQESLFQTLAMWNGKGHPPVAGDEIARSARVMHVASTAVMFCLHADPETAVAEVQRRSGTFLDPDLVSAFSRDMLDGIDDVDAYDVVLDLEPDPVRLIGSDALVAVSRTFGDLADLKSPWLRGHSSAVADLAAGAAQVMGFDPQTLRVAGHLHDIGRVGVSSRIWDKPGPLSATEADQARLHPYHTERILARVVDLADVMTIAGQHHERCDGSGYHRGIAATQLSMPSRILAAADCYRCQVEDRSYRPALLPTQAAQHLAVEARAGRLDGDAVAAVMQAAGQSTGVRRVRPAGLTDRQIDVLRLLSRGLSNREIAQRLVISNRTAEHHVQDIYTKIGASTRAAAALFAMEHGLMETTSD
jgi:HD-GYP domain-containing protein (c-di-GMP phosphodiesterase class II)